MRVFALALVVWLGADVLSHGTCTHDLLTFAANRSQVGDTGAPHDPSPDRDDINHCSCHWQFVPAAASPVVSLRMVAPVESAGPDMLPPAIPRSFERPPQRPLA